MQVYNIGIMYDNKIMSSLVEKLKFQYEPYIFYNKYHTHVLT